MPAKNSVGPQYMKSLRVLLKGPLGIHERKDIVRYRALQVMGLVDGVGVRCVMLTKAGKILLTSGILSETATEPKIPTPTPAEDFDAAVERVWTEMPF